MERFSGQLELHEILCLKRKKKHWGKGKYQNTQILNMLYGNFSYMNKFVEIFSIEKKNILKRIFPESRASTAG